MGEQQPSLLGQVLGGCRIESLLGRGALGSVYRAHQLSLDRSVALKLLNARQATREAIRDLITEAKVLAKINHPNVVKVYDVGVAGETPFILMEYLEGETLHKRLERAGRLPIEAAVKLAGEVAAGLGAAHKQGVVHRDLKPSNVFLRPSQRLKLIDFGLAHFGEARGDVSGGTPETMAPEQWTFGAVDGRADLYALGILIYRMVSGRMPFQAATLEALKEKHLNEKLPASGFPSHARSGDLFAVVMKLTRKKPEERYASADDVGVELAAVGEGRRPQAVKIFGSPKFCSVCETANKPSATNCIGCENDLQYATVDLETLLPEPEPEESRPATRPLRDLGARRRRRGRR